jgi:phosphomevalonate kinase
MNLPRTSESLSKIPPFSPTGVRLQDVHKTGLGSSAALITSIVCALLLHLQVVPPSEFSSDESDGKRLAHNLAQFVHCFAQGKVGSGFDVSSAVFGSQLYTRFGPAVLDQLMSDDSVRSRVPFTKGAMIVALMRPLSRASYHCYLSFHPAIQLGIIAQNRSGCRL